MKNDNNGTIENDGTNLSEKDQFTIVILIIIGITRTLYPHLIFIDIYNLAIFLLVLALLYKNSVYNFITNERVKSFKLGKEGLGIDYFEVIGKKLVELEGDMTAINNGNVVPFPQTNLSNPSKLTAVLGGKERFLAPPAEHASHIRRLEEAVSALQEDLTPGNLTISFSESVSLAAIEGRISNSNKNLLYKINEMLVLFHAYGHLVYTGQIITLRLIIERLREKIKTEAPN